MSTDPDTPVQTLIVDDVHRLRGLVADALSEAPGFKVVGSAADGKDAIEKTCALEPDLVLLDLSMPRMDGLEALTEIRRRVPTAEVVVLSGFTSERMEGIVEDHGARAYIEKGIEADALVTRLRELMRNGHREQSQEPSPCCRPYDQDPDPLHIHLVELDEGAADRLAGQLDAIKPGWERTRAGKRAEVPDASDVVLLAVADCEEPWEPAARSLSTRHPELPVLVALEGIPRGCLEASVRAGATDVVDIEREKKALAHRIRWAVLIDKHRESRTRQLEMLAGTMAHDLRHPLRTLDRYTEWVEDGLASGDEDRLETALDGIQRSIERAKRLIDRQLKYAKVQTKPEEAASVDPEEPLQEALMDLKERVQRSGAEIKVEDLPHVQASQEQLVMLFRNLLSNAIKYRKDGQEPTIRVHGETGAGHVRIRVSDDGIGIDPEHQDEIFDPFTRLHAEQDYPGTGLGLAICNDIVEQWGGTIQVDSERGEGTTITVILPAPSDGQP